MFLEPVESVMEFEYFGGVHWTVGVIRGYEED